ncbi:divalent metal ion transporter [Pichia kluyveri]|uniref:Divalent metal ion transporter n=1 Tax=Pichia kluyveri TaxID=36015 RepID=A0AAV5R0N7_PICKL|nr:divalent metal ion transporter [Pichia kluyveri]
MDMNMNNNSINNDINQRNSSASLNSLNLEDLTFYNMLNRTRAKWNSYSPLRLNTTSTTTTPNSDVLLRNNSSRTKILHIFSVLSKFIKYIGPGLMVSVAYMDPGNFSSSIASAQFQYKLLFSLVISNIMAGFLQILASKLGICTGQDLATNCRKHLHPQLNKIINIFAEVSVVATDVAEIIGTAIAFNIIFNIPLLYGVLLSIIDMLFVVMAYRPNGPMLLLRIFEGFVSLLVFGTVICFAVELAKVSPTTDWKDVALGFLPSKAVFTDIKGLYLSAALLGSNLMPHSLYLGSGVVQARMKSFDIKMGHYVPPVVKKSGGLFTFSNRDDDEDENNDDYTENSYKPSIHAIDETMNYTIAELIVSLIFVALFVNAAILIVAGSALSNPTDDDGDGALETADLFTLHHLLSTHLSKAAGSLFAFALLCSGLCGGTVVTIAGQMIMEGHSNSNLPPGIKRIITRVFALIPCITVVLIAGREGLSAVLNGSQVVLSFMLPFICAPLIYFTSNREIMKVELYRETKNINNNDSNIINNEVFEFVEMDDLSDKKISLSNNIDDSRGSSIEVGSTDTFEGTNNDNNKDPRIRKFNNDDVIVKQYKNMSNGKITTICAVFVWIVITFLNFWLLISMALGKDVPV